MRVRDELRLRGRPRCEVKQRELAYHPAADATPVASGRNDINPLSDKGFIAALPAIVRDDVPAVTAKAPVAAKSSAAAPTENWDTVVVQ